MVSGLEGSILAEALASSMAAHLYSDAVSVHKNPETPDSANVSAKYVVDALCALADGCKSSGLEIEATSKLSFALLNACHEKTVLKVHPTLWRKLTVRLGLDPAEAIRTWKDVLSDLLSGRIKQNVIRTLVKEHPPGIVHSVVKQFEDTVKVSKIMVTANAYQIFLSPKGELFDKQVLTNIQGESEKNIKRESKAYSYKEQMEEIALRKEIEEKRRREGKTVEVKLTPKQKELVNAQLEKEDSIREEVKEIKEGLDPILDLTALAVEANPRAFSGFISRLLTVLFHGMRSPICAERCCTIFSLLRRGVFVDPEDEGLSQLLAANIVRIKSPACNLSGKELSRKEIDANARSLVTRLCSATMAGDTELTCPLTTPSFSYAFPAIEHAVKKFLTDDELICRAYNLMNKHSQLRGLEQEESLCDPDDLHPKYLPLAEMMQLAVEVISVTGGRTQQLAAQTLIEVARAASEKPGCASAGEREIRILLAAIQTESEAVRDVALRGMQELLRVLGSQTDELLFDLTRRIWVARFDDNEECAKEAESLWEAANFETDVGLGMRIIDDVTHPITCIRRAGSLALAKLMEDQRSGEVDAILTLLLDTYKEKLELTKPVKDHLGRVVQDAVDHWEPRSGVAMALKELSPFYDVPMVKRIATFLVPTALDDRNESVRAAMLDAAVAVVDRHGKETAEELLPVFENFMEKTADSAKHDNVRQSVVILMGSMAKHLSADDPKVRPIMRQLIIALNTPSQQVQEAVAHCLPPLVPTIKEEAPQIVSNLIETLLGADIGYGERKGAAYGIAGIVKGLGILSLKQLDIMGRLTVALQDKKKPSHREGALFAFEMLCSMLGRLFEPYIVHILPHLLLCFGDPVEHVRHAADDTARAVMSKLSAHGVKLVLPSLLNALEEDQWRTKSGSVELLGAMAFCAPKQLSSCLPSIVPKLIEVLGDSHHKVQKAGAQALKQIGSVIRNPEIQAIVPILLNALQDPAKKTGTCLQTLLDTKFVHFIDAPSLALVMPVVQRAFLDRSTETRKMAAQIIGNMYSLTDQKDLSPYLPGIIPGLKNSLLDPVPEVRAVSARALGKSLRLLCSVRVSFIAPYLLCSYNYPLCFVGAMVKGMGESSFEELLPWLMSTLTSETSSVDRSGAAQGLAEVVGGLGAEKMIDLMPDIIRTASRNDIAPHVKDGYIMMFIYMPTVFPDEFTPYIAQVRTT